jgi:DMSO reductase anchor subunit
VAAPSESRRELDSTVVNIELTLASIIQGVALFFLTDNARASMSAGHWENFLYVAAGLCVIFIFWSRSIIHTLTLIKWPLEFGHNFFYIACALGESILVTRLDNPLAWFQLSAAYAAVVWLLFIYDMRLIRARIAESNDPADSDLYASAKADQLLNIWALVPLLLLLNLGCALSIWYWPDLFIARAGHIWLISIQLASFIGYLIYIGHYFRTIAPLLLRSREGASDQS